jgi:hypothetical protein
MGLLDDRKDDFLAQRLILVWRDELGLSKFMKVRLGEKTNESVREFLALARRLNQDPEVMLRLACGRYSPDWCKETFKTKYPPFALVVGKASRKWLARELGTAKRYNATTADLEQQAKQIVRTMLGTMSVTDALAVVAGGWPSAPDLRALMEQDLKGRAK